MIFLSHGSFLIRNHETLCLETMHLQIYSILYPFILQSHPSLALHAFLNLELFYLTLHPSDL